MTKHLARTGTKGRHPGGVAIYCRNSKSYKFQEIDTRVQGTICVKIDSTEAEIVLLILYRHPQRSKYHNNNLFRDVGNIIVELEARYPRAKLIVMGDFNARIGEENTVTYEDVWNDITVSEKVRRSKDKLCNGEGNELLDFCSTHNLDILNGKYGDDAEGNFTYVNMNGESVIDYAAVRPTILEWIDNFWVEPRIDSHHMAVCIKLRINGTNNELQNYNQGSKIPRFKWDAEKREIFQGNFERNFRKQQALIKRNIQLGNDITAIYLIEQIFQNSGKEMEVKCTGNRQQRENIWFTSECREARKSANSALKMFQWLGGTYLRRLYIQVRNTYKECIRNAKKNWQKNEEERIRKIVLTKDNKDIWTTIRKLRQSHYVTNSIDARDWLQHFTQLYSGRADRDNNKQLPVFQSETVENLDKPITLNEVEGAIRLLKDNKAPGTDGIPSEFIKSVNRELAATLKDIFNSLFDLGSFPEQWSTAIIQPIYKNKGDKNDTSSYRGISLLNTLGKIYCRILFTRLKFWSEAEEKISPLQAGFRSNHSTIDNIFIVHALAEKAISVKRGKLYCAFMDLEKAFDSVDRELLWVTLVKKGISKKFLKALQAIYSVDNACVRLKTDRVTESFKIRQGVKQGCVLSPLLFILFIDELIDHLTNTNTDAPETNVNRPIPGLLFADDLVLFSKTQPGLQKGLNTLEYFCDTKKLKVNTKKSKIMVFKNGSVYGRRETWQYKGEQLERVKEFTYLGVKMSMNLRWTKQKTNARRKGLGVLSEIHKASVTIPDIPPSLTEKMFKSLLIPTVAYGSEIWGAGDNSPLNILQTKYLKATIGVPQSTANSGILWEFGACSLNAVIKTRALKYWQSIRLQLRNQIVQECFTQNKERGWAKQIKVIIERVGLGELWENEPRDSDWEKISTRLTDIERQDIMENRSEKRSLLVQRLVGETWGKQWYIDKLAREERAGYGWFRLGGYMLNGRQSKSCLLCGDQDEDWIHILLICRESESWRENWMREGGYVGEIRDSILGERIMRDNRQKVVGHLGKYLSKVRKERAVRLESEREAFTPGND